jgi:hypothetical protein
LFIVQLWRENVDRRTKINERKAINSIGRLQNIGHENYGTLDRLFAEFWTGDTKIMVMRMTTTGQEDSEILDKRDGRIWKENGKILARRTAENWTWQNISKEDSWKLDRRTAECFTEGQQNIRLEEGRHLRGDRQNFVYRTAENRDEKKNVRKEDCKIFYIGHHNLEQDGSIKCTGIWDTY